MITLKLFKKALSRLAVPALIVSLCIPATARVEAVLEHDWLFEGNDPPCILNFKADSACVLAVHFVTDLSLMAERQDTVFSYTASIGEPGIVPVRFDLAPGFYQVRFDVDGKPCESFNIGVSPESIVSALDRQPDFDGFWAATLAELAGVPLEPVLTLMPEQCSPERNVYRVEYKSFGGVTVGGILAYPTADGLYPAVIEYMGYGADVYPYHGGSNPDRIEFLVSVRGQGIFREEQARWIDRGLSSKEEFYYRGAFCDVVRAIDFVSSLEKCDTGRMVAQGESQGGAFTWIAASLDHRVRAIAPAVPFLSDYQDYAKIVWWPMWEVFEQAEKDGVSKEDLYRMLSYFDIKNFTDRIECPVYMAFGLQDPVCPPHTNFAGYNQVKSAKRYMCVPLCGHNMWEQEAWSEARKDYFNTIFINHQTNQ